MAAPPSARLVDGASLLNSSPTPSATPPLEDGAGSPCKTGWRRLRPPDPAGGASLLQIRPSVPPSSTRKDTMLASVWLPPAGEERQEAVPVHQLSSVSAKKRMYILRDAKLQQVMSLWEEFCKEFKEKSPKNESVAVVPQGVVLQTCTLTSGLLLAGGLLFSQGAENQIASKGFAALDDLSRSQ
ncbi:unnamed protein product [Miscanthus lutarioriparius]|uniref:Uncharacterized protein n=1 Tax=Miscanthus lutarioriparius TaxID=422564 RepID=A0A811RSL7_9POAL|nr:unnamed protein product [Miscanthus lutarioriparius]